MVFFLLTNLFQSKNFCIFKIYFKWILCLKYKFITKLEQIPKSINFHFRFWKLVKIQFWLGTDLNNPLWNFDFYKTIYIRYSLFSIVLIKAQLLSMYMFNKGFFNYHKILVFFLLRRHRNLIYGSSIQRIAAKK